MLTLIPECALSKSGTSFLRSVIEGLSTEPTVMVVVPPPPPPPPAPEQAAPTKASRSPRAGMANCRFRDRRCLSLMQRHLFFIRPEPPMQTKSDNVVKRQRCQI